MLESLFTLFGLFLVSLPLVFVGLAWRSSRGHSSPKVTWRKRVFLIAIIGTILDYALIWANFLLHSRFEVYQAIGWTGEMLSLAFLVLAFAGTGLARVYAALAATGVALLWVSVGFY